MIRLTTGQLLAHSHSPSTKEARLETQVPERPKLISCRDSTKTATGMKHPVTNGFHKQSFADSGVAMLGGSIS